MNSTPNPTIPFVVAWTATAFGVILSLSGLAGLGLAVWMRGPWGLLVALVAGAVAVLGAALVSVGGLVRAFARSCAAASARVEDRRSETTTDSRELDHAVGGV